jgi:hypothetical protein
VIFGGADMGRKTAKVKEPNSKRAIKNNLTIINPNE